MALRVTFIDRAHERTVFFVKAFITTTAVAFGLLTLAHTARLAVEGRHLLKEPVFLLTSLGSICICVWAVILLRRVKAQGS